MKAIRLKTEHLFNPLGIDILKPRLMWNCEGGVKQTAYEIVTEKWQSGKVESSAMHAEYPLPLRSRERVNWKVRLWDENGEPGEWSEAFFEMGLLFAMDWKATWITGNYSVNKKERYPVDCFRKAFAIGKPVRSARLYITACGLYEARLGGKKVGDFVMAPGYTDYRRRVQYQTYDVADLLAEGENELTVQLADGWYRGSCGAWGRKNQYGTETKLLAQLEIVYEDGSQETVSTDATWQWSNDGPIRFADNKDGEIVEAFRTPLYTGQAKETSHKVIPSASNNVPVTEHERFKPVMTTAPNGRKLLDFGQNIAGYVQFSVKAHVGQRMVWRFGEMLDEEGNLTQKNIQLSRKGVTTPLQKIEYTCGEGPNEYKTTFAVFGFQYAEVETDVELDPEKICSVAVYSDLERTGDFSSSHPLVDQLFQATLWSAKGNHLDIPTDCPTRERHGWTGDAQLFFTSAAYLFDFAPFARKYLHDVFDWQKKDGRLPHIAPDGGADFYMWTMNGSVGWSDVGVLIPWRYAEIYQDEAILREYYDGMAKYARFMEKRCGQKMPLFAEKVKLSKEAQKFFVNKGQSYGEWAEPADVDGGFHWQDFVAPHPEVSTAYTAYVLGLMAQIARRLGHAEDAEEFQSYSDGCRKAYQELVHTDKFPLDTDRQARLVRPLYLGLLDEADTEFAKKRLIKALENYNWRLGTGFLSTPLILYVLASYDIEAAYKLLENEEIPGWLSMPKAGATTIWEAWEGPASTSGGIGSLNHYSKGAVIEWLFSVMCGIRVDGENHFTVAPQPGGSFTHAEAGYTSIFGRIESRWKRELDEHGKGMKTICIVTVPTNCTALVRLPGGTEQTVGAGTHVFTEE
ncbi:MAG: family 78 glycoside hydrolase catalytic domain [Lachnospiraceae bacterium]|nr:family 78 glycoside hydrolase catalytic domain [Lachnospiraceae bacterium]